MSDREQIPKASPGPARTLFLFGLIAGVIGFFLGFYRLGDGGWAAAVIPVVALSVGVGGVIAFLRHSVFHRSDAVRMGWDLGRRNDFQIEVGFANLAWGVTGLLSWLLAWDTQAQGAVTLVFGLYMLAAASLHLGAAIRGGQRGYGPVVMAGSFAVLLLVFAVGALVG